MPTRGLPDVLYVDHGNNFISHRLAHNGVDLHIWLTHPKVPSQCRGKIEPFFCIIRTELLAALPGYIDDGQPWPTPKRSLAESDTAIEGLGATYN